MKKIISLLVITTMIFSMVASLNITTASAATTSLYNFQYFNANNSKLYTTYDGTTYGGKTIQVSSEDPDGLFQYYEDGIKGITTEPCFNIKTKKLIWNNKSNISFSEHPVVNINFQYYIPKGTENDARFLHLELSKKSTTATTDVYKNSTYGTYNFYFNSSNNYVAGTVSGNAERVTLYNTSLVPSGEWHDASLKIITETASDGKKSIKVNMYVDGRKHIECKSKGTISFNDIGINQIYFNTTNGDTHTADTYIKNIRVDYEDADPTMYNVLLFDADEITFDDNNKLTAAGHGAKSTSLESSTQSGAFYEESGVYKNVTYSAENGTLKVSLTPSTTSNDVKHATIQNFKGNITNYFPAGTNYMQMSYDIKIPSGSVSATREQHWRIGNNTGSTNTSIYTIGSRIKDGILNFYNNAESYNGDDTTRKSAPFTITPDKWYRIITLLKVTNIGTDYVLHTEGYVKDLATDTTYKIYEEDEAFPKLNGTDGLVIAQQRTDILTMADEEKNPVDTYYDNFLTRFWNEDFSDYYTGIVTDNLPKDATDIFNIEINCHDGKNAVAKARKVEGITNEKLILAAYDANNKLVGIKVSTSSDISDEQFTKVGLDITGKGAKKLKAFFFDDITKCNPLATATELEVK